MLDGACGRGAYLCQQTAALTEGSTLLSDRVNWVGLFRVQRKVNGMDMAVLAEQPPTADVTRILCPRVAPDLQLQQRHEHEGCNYQP